MAHQQYLVRHLMRFEEGKDPKTTSQVYWNEKLGLSRAIVSIAILFLLINSLNLTANNSHLYPTNTSYIS